MNEPLVLSLTSQLTARLRENILAGTYPPGSPLRQDAIAASYGISKIPVREALVQLQSEGLVDTFPNRGFQVRPLVTSELDEVFRLRLQMEPSAAALGARIAYASDRLAAEKALERLDESVQRREFANSGALNRAFHVQLIVPRLQPATAELLGRLLTLAERYVRAHLAPAGRVERASREHAEILHAWYAGKVKTVRELLQEHIGTTLADLEKARRLAAHPNP